MIVIFLYINEVFEKEIVQRSKVKISPNKIRRKDLSNKSDKAIKYGHSDKKPHMYDKKDKNEQNVSIDRIKMLKTKFDENAESIQNDEMSTHKTVQSNEILKLGAGFSRKNAFEVLLKSANGGITPPNKPRKQKSRKQIGSKSQGSSQKSLREWLKKD